MIRTLAKSCRRLIPSALQHARHLTVRRVARNTVALLTAQVVDRAAAYLFLLYITRVFGSEFFGTYVTVVTLVLMAGSAVDIGLYNLMVRDLAQDRSRLSEYLGKLLPLRMGLGLTAVMFVQGLAWLFAYPAEIALLAGIASASLLIGVPAALLMGGVTALEHIHVAAVCSTVGNLLTTVFSVAALHFGAGLRGVFVGWLVAGTISMALAIAVARRLGVTVLPRLDRVFLFRIARDAAPFAAITLVAMATRVDVLLLSKWHGPEAVGLYSAARRPLELLLFIPGSFVGALYPVVAAQYVASRERLWRTYVTSVYGLLCFAIPLWVGVTILSDRLVVALYGETFRSAADVLPYLAAALAFAMLSMTDGNMIFSARLTGQFVPYALGNALLTVVLNMILIPRFGYIGAGIATLVATVTAFLVQRLFLTRLFGRAPALLALSVRPLLAGGVMAIVVSTLSFVGTLPLLALGCVAYGVALLALGGHRRPELASS